MVSIIGGPRGRDSIVALSRGEAGFATALPLCFFRVMLFDGVSRMCCPS